MFHQQFLATSVICVLSVSLNVAQGEVTRTQAARLCVDVVLTRNGGELRGSIVSRGEDGSLIMGVRREWLREHQPELFATEGQREAAGRIEAYGQLETRIREWLREVRDESELSAILNRELEEYAGFLRDPERIPDEAPSEFLLISVAANEQRRVYAQPADRKQAALVAFSERLPDVEASDFPELQELLAARELDWRGTRVDLSDRLPRVMPQSEREWAARRAVYEFAFRNRIEFQGTGELVFRAGDDAQPPALEQLLGGLLNGGLNLNLDLNQLPGGDGQVGPDDRPGWRETAIQGTEDAGAAGCRVTRVETDLENGLVVVESVFLARIGDGVWETVWSRREAMKSGDAREALADRIRQDPQVAEPLKLLESLGLNDGVEQAVQFGAATMDAQQAADDRFFEFFDRFTQRLDGPPLRW